MLPQGVQIVFASGFSGTAALLLAALGGLLVVRAYTRPVRRLAGVRWMLPAWFRGLAAVGLVLLILRPELDIEKTRVDPRALLLLLDSSASMSLRDAEDAPSRLRQAALGALDCERCLAAVPSLQVRLVPFADAPRRPVSGEDILQLEPAGDESDLGSALALAAEMTPRVERVILITDGNDTTGLDPVKVAAGLGVPVDTVAVGCDLREDETYRDLAVQGLEHRDSTPVGSVTQVVANIEAIGFPGRTVEVALRCGAETLARGEIVLDGQKGTQPVTLNFHPRVPGLMDLTVLATPLPGERVAENNAQSFSLAVHEKLPRVVYVEGSMRPEYKFLRRVLATDPGLEFMSLVRVREGDFLRQGSVGGMELDGLPRTRADISALDVLILGDVVAAEVGDEALALVREAVAERLGLLILSAPATTGSESAYGGTALAPVFPAVPQRESSPAGMVLRPVLTAAGDEQALGPGLRPFFGADASAARVPLAPLGGVDRMARVRPAATVVLDARAEGDPSAAFPLLVLGRFGKGKVALFTGHDAWRWSFGNALASNPYAQLWGQVVRWLATSEEGLPASGPAFSVTASQLIAQAGQEIVFSAALRGFQEGGEPRIVADVERGETVVDHIGFSPVPALAGAFQGRFSTTRPGRYSVRVRAVCGEQEVAARALSLRIRGGQGEFARLSPDRKRLARIARETGGEVLRLEALAESAAAWVGEERRRQEIVHVVLWHDLGLFLAVVLCLSLEWSLRKRAGLP